jgi:hypothetical protein
MRPVCRSARTFAARCSWLHQRPAFELKAAAISGFTRQPKRPEHGSDGSWEQNSGSNGYTSAPGAVTENITVRPATRRFSSSRLRVSRAQVGANSGHVREEHRITPSGIARPQEQRWKTRRNRMAGAVPDTSGIGARRPSRRNALDDPPKLVREFVNLGRVRFGGTWLSTFTPSEQRFESARRLP